MGGSTHPKGDLMSHMVTGRVWHCLPPLAGTELLYFPSNWEGHEREKCTYHPSSGEYGFSLAWIVGMLYTACSNNTICRHNIGCSTITIYINNFAYSKNIASNNTVYSTSTEYVNNTGYSNITEQNNNTACSNDTMYIESTVHIQ